MKHSRQASEMACGKDLQAQIGTHFRICCHFQPNLKPGDTLNTWKGTTVLDDNADNPLKLLKGQVDEYSDETNQDHCTEIVTPTNSDEGYETDIVHLKVFDNSSINTSNDTVQPAPFTLSHRLVVEQKTQHFSKWLIALAHTPTNEEAGRIKARYINLPSLRQTMSNSKITFQSNFYTRLQELNEGSSDGLAFGKALFCQKGKLRREDMSTDKQYL